MVSVLVLCLEPVYIPVHDTKKLLPDILYSPHAPGLDIVFVAPRIAELASLPSIVHSEQCQMIAFGLVEFGLLAVRLSLLLFRPIENILSTSQHGDDSQNLL